MWMIRWISPPSHTSSHTSSLFTRQPRVLELPHRPPKKTSRPLLVLPGAPGRWRTTSKNKAFPDLTHTDRTDAERTCSSAPHCYVPKATRPTHYHNANRKATCHPSASGLEPASLVPHPCPWTSASASHHLRNGHALALPTAPSQAS